MEKGRKWKEINRNLLVLESQIAGNDRYSSMQISIDFKKADFAISLINDTKGVKRIYQNADFNPIQIALELTHNEFNTALELITEAKQKAANKHANKRQISKKIDSVLSAFKKVELIRK